MHCVLEKNVAPLYLLQLSQMSLNFANSWQKHTPGNFKQTQMHMGNHISFRVFVLYRVKSSSDFTAYSRPTASNAKFTQKSQIDTPYN